ncbi:uncharacterized protein LOC119735482 [Patiria miniata]|uniref:Uncharacterized protein n=1 Tax=Patiria miniata TaxID=46514 RepID=A0A914AM59_PATMI|nr:uncharacterized protein LOC119735482 [Patiria miniata]
MICKDCVRSYHHDQEHAAYDIREISDRYRQNLRDQIQVVDTERQATEQAWQTLEKVEKDYKRKVDQALENVKEAVAKIIKEVETKGKQAVHDIEHQRERRSQSFHDERAELQEQKKRLSEKIEEAKRVTDITRTPNNTFLLQYPAALEKFQKPVGAPSKMQAQLSYPMFLEGPSVGGIDLGKLVMVDTWKQVHTIGRKGNGEGEFEGARGIAAAKPDKIAVTDRKNGRVVICNSQGNNWKSISIEANDVAATPKRWVIANPTAVQLYNKEDAEYVSEFKTVSEDEKRRVNLIALAVKTNGNIIVGDDMKVLTEHSPDGSILRTIRIEIKPFFLAVMYDQRFDQLVEVIAISDLNQRKVFIIEVSDTDVATKLREIHPILEGKPAMDCRGMCADDSGIYIAATTKTFNKCHVHHYDTRGRFIACVAKDLYNPYGLTFTADGQRLAVADCQSVKIYAKE